MRHWLWLALFMPAVALANGCGKDDAHVTPESGGAASGGRGGGSGSGGSGGSAGRGSGGGAGAQGGGAGDAGAAAGEGGADSVSFDDIDAVRLWATTASALAVYVNVYQPFAVADGQEAFGDPSCPVTTDDGTTLDIEGGCTDVSGTEWVGSATVERSANGDRSLTLRNFGTRVGASGDVRNGNAQITFVDVGEYDFSLSIVHRADVTTTIDYFGAVSGDYGARSVWTGTGVVTREGGTGPVGTVDATTTKEVADDAVCSGQPASGNTVLENHSGDTVIVTYDGSVDCDDEHAATYSVNGAPQGAITGIVCSMSHGPPAERPLVLLSVLGLGVLFGVRRRAFRTP